MPSPVEFTSELDETASRPGTVSDRVYRHLQKYEWWWVAGFCVLMFCADVAIDHKKKLWFDEVYTVMTASQPTLGRLWAALPADGNPPLLALIDHLLFPLMGTSSFVIRLPCLLGMIGALLLLYRIVRSMAGEVAGLAAMALFMLQPAWLYAAEARPYGLLLFFTLLAAYGWQLASSRSGPARHVGLCAISLGMAGAILSHNAGALEAGFPLMLAEGVAVLRRRSLDRPIMIAFAIGLTPLAATIFLIHATTELFRQTLPAYPPSAIRKIVSISFHDVASTLFLVIEYRVAALCLCLGLLVSPLRARVSRWVPKEIQPQQWALGWGFALLIPVTAIAFEPTIHSYNSRYGIGSAAGLALLGTIALASRAELRKLMLPVVVLWAIPVFFWQTCNYYKNNIQDFAAQPTSLSTIEPALPIAVPNPFRYLPIWWYSPPEERGRLIYLSNRAEAEAAGILTTEPGLEIQSKRFPIRVYDYDQFLKANRKFVVYLSDGPKPRDLAQRVKASGYQLTATSVDGVWIAERPN